MIKAIKIIGVTETGVKAIQNNIIDFQKVRGDKLMFKMLGFEKFVESEEPYIFTIRIKNPHFQKLLRPEHLLFEIENALKDYGAKKNIDYKVEVEE